MKYFMILHTLTTRIFIIYVIYARSVIIYSQGGSGGNEGGDLKIFSLGKGGHPIILV